MRTEDDRGLDEAVILCGGLGTRLRSAVADRPKALAVVRGRPFVEWILLHLARRDRIRHVVLATGHLGEMIEQHFGHQTWWGLKLSFSHETHPLGTAGALRLAAPLTTSPQLLVLNGDTYCDYDCGRLLDIQLGHAAAATLWLSQARDHGRFGSVTMDEAGRITSFSEKAVASGPRLVSAGVYLIERGVITSVQLGQTASLERDVFPGLLDKGLYGVKGEREFVDIGTPQSLGAADDALAQELDGLDCE